MKWSVIRRKLERVDRVIDKAIEKAEIPGAVVLAQMPRNGETLDYSTARGLAVVRPERIPAKPDTIFDVASLTKPLVTTTAVMLLVDDGMLDLDAPVCKYLPEFAERDKEEVTLRHLLTHSSGLKPWRPFHETLMEKELKSGQRWIGSENGRKFVLDRTLRSAPVHEPGEAAVYGDLDFIALGALVESVSRRRLDEFCSERIFGPLGMKDTFFAPVVEGVTGSSLPDALRRRVAATESCSWRGRIVWGEVHDPNASAMGGVAGHAGLFSTAPDIMKFATTVLDVWHGRSEFWPREILADFFTRQEIPAGSDWAVGWDTPAPTDSSAGSAFSRNSVGHLGFTGTSLWIDLDSECVVVMLTNRIHLVAKKSRFGLRPVVHDLLRDSFEAG
ncbi:beta-lactamase family protein [Myxococcota bacterium]|nr:beta-lactamase family protein [Myxococcota bacterium]